VLGTIDALARDVSDTLLRIDRKLAELPAVPRALADRVDALRRRVRPVLDERDERSIRSRANARLPLFLFVFAEELSRSFLPLYAAEVYRPISEVPYLGPLATMLGLGGGLPPEVVIGLPIMVFMGGVALATPFGGTWVGRYGSRTIFLVGAVPATIGYFGTALALTTYDMLIWRLLSAVGYALITIACQGYLAQVAGGGGGRARTMAVFVAAITTAVICGSAIGAVFADRFGYRATFGIAGLFVLLATLLAARYMDQPHDPPVVRTPLHGQFRAFANPRFLALVVLAAIPAKIALTGFLFYTTPIFLAELDFSQPAIGRMIMLYGLLMLVGTQLGAQLHDRTARYGVILVALGGLLTGAALLAPQLYAPGPAMALAISVFGLAQGIASAPMLAVLPQLCPDDVQIYGMTSLASLLRLSERAGSVIGPLLAAFLTVHLSYADAITSIGSISALSALLFLVVVGGAALRPVARTADLG
jgi:predicted MFS family arabinose efflux permease